PSRLRFFVYATRTPVVSTLSLHDALPISWGWAELSGPSPRWARAGRAAKTRIVRPEKAREASERKFILFKFYREFARLDAGSRRSEEHTSELQSPYDLVCRLLLEKKKKQK